MIATDSETLAQSESGSGMKKQGSLFNMLYIVSRFSISQNNQIFTTVPYELPSNRMPDICTLVFTHPCYLFAGEVKPVSTMILIYLFLTLFKHDQVLEVMADLPHHAHTMATGAAMGHAWWPMTNVHRAC